jgi:hypothetical protein
MTYLSQDNLWEELRKEHAFRANEEFKRLHGESWKYNEESNLKVLQDIYAKNKEDYQVKKPNITNEID